MDLTQLSLAELYDRVEVEEPVTFDGLRRLFATTSELKRRIEISDEWIRVLGETAHGCWSTGDLMKKAREFLERNPLVGKEN